MSVEVEPFGKDKRMRHSAQLDRSFVVVKGCTGKVQYRKRRVAEETARRMTEEKGEHLCAYRCRRCGTYHVGHPPLRYILGLEKYKEMMNER